MTATKLDLTALDRDFTLFGDNTEARTITIGQQITFSDVVIVDVAVATFTGKLVLPSVNVDATPTFAFGDGDTGFYEKADDVIGVSVGGFKRFLYQSNLFGADNVKGGYLQNLTSSATIVTVGPRRDDTNTGLGGLADDTIALITGGLTAMIIDASQRVAILGTPTADGLTIQHGGVSIIVGADNQAATLTDATAKNCRIGAPHYSNAATETNLLYANNTLTANLVNIGGGTGLLNAATEIKFYTAATTTTTSGTSRMIINAAGRVQVTGDLLLSSNNDAATPSLAFGDGDSGWYEQSDDLLAISIGGTQKFIVSNNLFGATNVLGGWMLNLTSTASQATCGPRRGDTNTGLGGVDADTLALLTGGVTAILINAAQEVGIGIVPLTGVRLLLPLENDPVTPTFAFGDGDSGFFEQADDILDVATAGAKRFIWSGNFYQSAVLNGAWMRNLNGSATEPNVGPDVSENTTGMGSAGTDQISLITAALEAINISATQETTIQGPLAVSNAAEGNTAKLSRKTATEKHTLDTATTSDTTTISIPSGARLLAVSFNVDTAVTNDGDNTWSAAFIMGSTTTLATLAAAAQNTKVDLMLPDEISSDVCEIQFTPQSGSFTAGVIEIVAYYEVLTSLADA